MLKDTFHPIRALIVPFIFSLMSPWSRRNLAAHCLVAKSSAGELTSVSALRHSMALWNWSARRLLSAERSSSSDKAETNWHSQKKTRFRPVFWATESMTLCITSFWFLPNGCWWGCWAGSPPQSSPSSEDVESHVCSVCGDSASGYRYKLILQMINH